MREMKILNRLKESLNTAIVCLMATGASALNESQQDGPKVTQTIHQDWQSICVKEEDKPELCIIRQPLTVKLLNGQVVDALIVISRQNEGYILEIKLPLGLDLRGGLILQVDANAKINRPFTTCITKGCIVLTDLNEALISSFKSGVKLKISFALISSVEKLHHISASLLGFSRAIEIID